MRFTWAEIFPLAVPTTAAVVVPQADQTFPCDCPIFEPAGTCTLTHNPSLASNAPNSAVCGTKGFNYICQGTFDKPNCVSPSLAHKDMM